MNLFDTLEYDIFHLKKHDLKIYFVGHGTLMFTWGDLVIHVDPVSDFADYSTMPRADVILITHQHYDHLEKKALEKVYTKSTKIFLDKESAESLGKGTVMNNGDVVSISEDITLKAVPAYNTTEERKQFHPEGRDNGYLVSFDSFNVYVAGDTEPIPEMSELGRIDVAFLPMNQPYTMTPEQVAEAVKVIKPDILYPYHFGSTDTGIVVRLLEASSTEVRIRSLA